MGEFPGPVVKDSVLSLQRTPVQSLVGELRSDRTCGVSPPKKTQNWEKDLMDARGLLDS